LGHFRKGAGNVKLAIRGEKELKFQPVFIRGGRDKPTMRNREEKSRGAPAKRDISPSECEDHSLDLEKKKKKTYPARSVAGKKKNPASRKK